MEKIAYFHFTPPFSLLLFDFNQAKYKHVGFNSIQDTPLKSQTGKMEMMYRLPAIFIIYSLQ